MPYICAHCGEQLLEREKSIRLNGRLYCDLCRKMESDKIKAKKDKKERRRLRLEQ